MPEPAEWRHVFWSIPRGTLAPVNKVVIVNDAYSVSLYRSATPDPALVAHRNGDCPQAPGHRCASGLHNAGAPELRSAAGLLLSRIESALQPAAPAALFALPC